MSKVFCSSCGTESDGGAFCNNCGAPIEQAAKGQPTQQPVQQNQYAQPTQQPQYAQAPQYQQPPGYYQPPGMNYHQKSDYERPPDYKFTETILERVVGTLKFDVHVVEEIEDRSDLDQEAKILLLANFGILAIVQIISIIVFPDVFVIDSMVGMIVNVLLYTFVGGLALIYLIALVGKSIGGQRTQTSTEEILRVLAYGYVATSISQFFGVMFGGTENILLSLFALFLALYSAVVFIFVIRRALDRGYGIAILTIIIAGIGWVIVVTILDSIVNSIFGGSYTQIPL